MKNFENYQTKELSYNEMNETNGGFLIALAIGIYLGMHWSEVTQGFSDATK